MSLKKVIHKFIIEFREAVVEVDLVEWTSFSHKHTTNATHNLPLQQIVQKKLFS